LIGHFKKLLQKIGVDGAVFYSVLARGFQAFSGFISIFLVSKSLSIEEQGFYYTFTSILALQIFFEMGLNGIITQYVAHEAAFLEWSEGKLQGEEKNLSRLSSLLRFCIKWYTIAAAILLFVLQITGYFFFKKFNSNPDINWKIPWIIIVLSNSVAFMINPLMSFVQGLGMVKRIEKLRFLQQVSNTIILWFGLVMGAKLYSGAVSSVLSLSLIVVILINRYKPIIRPIWDSLKSDLVNYKEEIFPYQWKISVSWVSGYFIFQIFNPVLFATQGAEVAGKMGMTLAVLNGVLTLSTSWINTKVPLFSGMIAKKNYIELDKLFNKTFVQSTIVNVSGLTLFIGVINGFKVFGLQIADRFLTHIPLICMAGSFLMSHIVGCLSVYLRCHKREPYLGLSITCGILCLLSAIILGKNHGLIGMTVGYFLINIGISFWAYLIFLKKKYEWHIKIA
jgi:O-antigen/teichoic acid export membrane protein